MSDQTQNFNTGIEQVYCQYCRQSIIISDQKTEEEFDQGFHNHCKEGIDAFGKEKYYDILVLKELEQLLDITIPEFDKKIHNTIVRKVYFRKNHKSEIYGLTLTHCNLTTLPEV